MLKLIKYENIISLCHAKLSSIQDKISKALSDGKISDEEFCLISEEDRIYELQKSEILKKEKKNKKSQSLQVLTEEIAKILQRRK